MGKKTLISSTNPVHSLSSLCDQDFWGRSICKVEGVDNLYAIEIDISDTVQRYKTGVRDKVLTFLKSADIPLNPEPFIEVATTNPAFEEAAMFEDMIGLILTGDFDIYIFDTAPVAHTYRLLGMSKVYDLWLRRMIKSREEALSTRVKLSFRKEKILEEIKKDPLLADLLDMRKRTEEARKLLMDPTKTAFFFTTLPLALPIAVIERFITWVRAFEIPVGGVIVNAVIPKEGVDLETASSYIVNKIREQEHYLNLAHQKFGDLLRGYIPLFETEVHGVSMIAKVAEALAK